jgi:hypothetical protein
MLHEVRLLALSLVNTRDPCFNRGQDLDDFLRTV